MSAAYPYGATGGLESPGTYKIAEPSGTTGTGISSNVAKTYSIDPYGNLGLSGSYNTTKVITYGPSSATEALKTSGTYVTSGVTTKPEDYGAKSGSYETCKFFPSLRIIFLDRSPSYSANTGLKSSNSYEINCTVVCHIILII